MSNKDKEEFISISCETGVVRKTTVETVANPSVLMGELLPVPPTIVPLSSRISFVADSTNKTGYGICALDALTFNAHWFETKTKNVILPILATRTSTSLGAMKLIWKNPIPEIMSPVFISEFAMTENYHCTGVVKCYLAFVSKETGEFKCPPLPNVYEDGGLCTGNLDFGQAGIIDAVPSVLAQWASNAWNADLLNDWKKRYLRDHFSFDMLTGENIVKDPSGKWFQDLPACGRAPGRDEAIKENVVYEAKRIIQNISR